jgi:hypothetical protein
MEAKLGECALPETVCLEIFLGPDERETTFSKPTKKKGPEHFCRAELQGDIEMIIIPAGNAFPAAVVFLLSVS